MHIVGDRSNVLLREVSIGVRFPEDIQQFGIVPFPVLDQESRDLVTENVQRLLRHRNVFQVLAHRFPGDN